MCSALPWRVPYRTTDDHIGGVVLTLVSVSARKGIETALRASEKQFHSFVDVASDTIYKMSADWSETRNLQGYNFLADTKDPNRSWLEQYIPSEAQPEVQAAIVKAIRTKRTFELEHPVIRQDGTVGWTFSRAVPQLDERGEIVEWFGAASDIMARRQAQEALLEKQQQLLEALAQDGHGQAE